jgi:flagellar FliJ protein
MMELDKLDAVAMLARSQENAAAGKLEQGRSRLAQSNSQLSQLEAFKLEYEQRLATLAQSGMAARQLQDYRRFLANLNAAIGRQGTEVSRAEGAVQEDREALLQRSLRRESLDMLVARGRKLLLEQTDRREQRDSDELNLQSHHRGRS